MAETKPQPERGAPSDSGATKKAMNPLYRVSSRDQGAHATPAPAPAPTADEKPAEDATTEEK